MNIQTANKKQVTVSRIAIIIILLALIRCTAEPFRLQYYSTKVLTFADIKPFLIGSLVTGLALLIMIILSFFGKHKIISAMGLLTVAVLLVIKRIYPV